MLKRQWKRMLVVGKGNPKTSLAIFVSLLVLLVIPSLASAGCKYVDPRQSASGYQNWCKCIGGTPYWKGGNLACTPPKGGGQSSPAGDDPLLQGAKELGESLHKLLFDDPQEKARQKEGQEQVLRSLDEMSRNRMGSEDEMLRNAAEKARQLDNQGRSETLSNLKGIPSISGDDLKLKPSTSFFGIFGNPQAEKDSWTDPSVVDLRDKKELVVDPRRVKGEKEKDLAQPSPQQYFRSPELDRAILQTRHASRGKIPFPKNPDEPLINPLREPERYQAWSDSVRAALNERLRKNRAEEILTRIDSDPELNKAWDRIMREENAAINKAYERNLEIASRLYDELDRKSGVDYTDQSSIESGKNIKIQESPQYKEQERGILDNFWKEMDLAGVEAWHHSLQELANEVEKLKKRFGEKSQIP